MPALHVLEVSRTLLFRSAGLKVAQGALCQVLFNATKFGPKCPQTPHSSILPVSLKEPDVAFSEFECLNLNVTVPLAALPQIESKEATALLPVMVWVHGCVIVSWFDVFPILVSQQFDSYGCEG